MIVNVCASSRNSRENFCQVYYYLDEEQSTSSLEKKKTSLQEKTVKKTDDSSEILQQKKRNNKIAVEKTSFLKKLYVKMTSLRRVLI